MKKKSQKKKMLQFKLGLKVVIELEIQVFYVLLVFGIQ